MAYGLLGEHLSHSFSPQIHSLLGDYEYSLFETAPEKLREFIRSGNFDGINVTIPYKKDVMKYLDVISDEARKIGSVNTVTYRGGRLYGDNTDYYGFLYMIKKSGISVENKKALVLGGGGASLTAVAVLRDLAASEIVVISRNGENNYDNISRHSDARIIVNTTPVGMYPDNLKSTVDLDDFPLLEGVFDIVYNPLSTKLILDAREKGLACASGISMLVAQAVKANEIFFGRKLPDSVCAEVEKKLISDVRNIVLIGMPGCGKSTVGRALAEITGKKFVDTDKEVEKAENRTIPELFSLYGEEYFRKAEASAVKAAGKEKSLVIATGGGVVTRDENYYPLCQNGVIVFLNRDLQKLTTEGRPLSEQIGIKTLYEKRLPLYRKFADIEIDMCDDAYENAHRIVKELTKYENSHN